MPTTYALTPVAHRLPAITALYPCEAILPHLPAAGQAFQVQRYVQLNQEGQGVWRDVPTDVRIADYVAGEDHFHVVKFNAHFVAGRFVSHRVASVPTAPVLAPSGEIAPVANLQLVVKRSGQPDTILSPTIVSTTHNRTASEFVLTWTNASNPGLSAKAYISDYNLPLKAVRVRFRLTFTQSLSGLNVTEVTLRWAAVSSQWLSPLGFVRNASLLRHQGVTRTSSTTDLHVWKANPSADPGSSLRYNYRNLQRLLPLTYGPYLNTPIEWDSGAWWTAAQAMRVAESAPGEELTQSGPTPADSWRTDSLGIPGVTWLGLNLKLDGWLLWPTIQAAIGFAAVDPAAESAGWQQLMDADPCFMVVPTVPAVLPKTVSTLSKMYQAIEEFYIPQTGYQDLLYGELPQQVLSNDTAESTFRGHLYRSHSTSHYAVSRAAGNFALRCADGWARRWCLAVANHAQQLLLQGVSGQLDHGKEVLPYERNTAYNHSNNIDGLMYAHLLGDYHALDALNLNAAYTHDKGMSSSLGSEMREMTSGIQQGEVYLNSSTVLTTAQKTTLRSTVAARVATLTGRFSTLDYSDQWQFNPELYWSSSFTDSQFVTLYARLQTQERGYAASGTIVNIPIVCRAYRVTRDLTHLYKLGHMLEQFLHSTYQDPPYDAATFGIATDDGRIGCYIEKLAEILVSADVHEDDLLSRRLYEPGHYPQALAGSASFDPNYVDNSPIYILVPRSGNITLKFSGQIGYVFLDPAGVQTNYNYNGSAFQEVRQNGWYWYPHTVSQAVTQPGLCTLKTHASWWYNTFVPVSSFPEARILKPGVTYWVGLSRGCYVCRDGDFPGITVLGWWDTDYSRDNKTFATRIKDYFSEIGLVRGQAQQQTFRFNHYTAPYRRGFLDCYTQGGGACRITVDRECLFLADSFLAPNYPDTLSTARLIWSLLP